VLAVVIAAFNDCQDSHGVPSPLKGLKKPAAKPRLHSSSEANAAAMLQAAGPPFRDFLFAADPARKRYSCYSCRHTFAHRVLSGYWSGGAGCSVEALAELIGDTPKVAFDHYGREWGQHYQEPL
jgi:hypothetical protein